VNIRIEMQRDIYLIRGLPGAGKTELAGKIAEITIEADMYFIKDGIYRYDREKIGLAHSWCKTKAANAMEDHFECIAVANTFSQRWEMIDYYSLALDYGYRITAITVNSGLSDEELARRNRHGVPIESIRAMRERWEL